MRKKSVTITHVAKAAGVSATAVSFAFNNPEMIGTETAERIRTIARELGYSPSPLARAMVSQSTGVIGFLVPQSISLAFTNPFMTAFLQGVGSVCDEHSLNVQVVSPYKGSLEEATRRAPVDAYIVLGLNENHEEIDPLRRRNVPFVVVDGDAEKVSSINIDNEGGAYSAAAHLLGKGHRDFLILVFDRMKPDNIRDAFSRVGVQRIEGYRRAFEECGCELPLERLADTEISTQGGALALRKIWEDGQRPTAVLSMSDIAAIGVIQEAQRLGIRVPQDLEVIGFDDIPLAEFVQPGLSTVSQPTVEKGRRAAAMLVAALESETALEPEKVCYPTQLVLRGTTR